MPGPHQPPIGGTYSRTNTGSQPKPITSGDLEAMAAEFGQRFSQLAELLTHEHSNVALPTTDSAAQTRYWTKKARLWKYVGGTAIAAVLALGTFASNLWSYLQGYANDRANEIIQAQASAEAAADLVAKVDQHGKLIDEMSRAPAHTEKLEQDVADLQRMHILQSRYMLLVVEALQARRRIPNKPPQLEELEQELLGASP